MSYYCLAASEHCIDWAAAVLNIELLKVEGDVIVNSKDAAGDSGYAAPKFKWKGLR